MQVLVTARPGGITGFSPGLGAWWWALAQTQATLMFTCGGRGVLGHLVRPEFLLCLEFLPTATTLVTVPCQERGMGAHYSHPLLLVCICLTKV